MRNFTVSPTSLLGFLLFISLLAGALPSSYFTQQQPLEAGPAAADAAALTTNTVPAFPVVVQSQNQTTCRLDLSDELFGGVQEACGRTNSLDRSRCCPVLAAWLFAAHARSALEVGPASPASPADVGPVMPDDSQRCVDTLQGSLEARGIGLPRPNASCDAVLCFCGIRLHQIGSLTCPAAFNVSAAARNATPMAAVRELERNCRNASFAGCTRCLQSLEKVKGGGGGGDVKTSGGGGEDRAKRMFERDCQLMGLTWLLARNKTLYIPTVSAVLRAVLYGGHPPAQPYQCSADQENMPLAVDSLQFQRASGGDAAPSAAGAGAHVNRLYSLSVLFLVSVAGHVLFLRGT